MDKPEIETVPADPRLRRLAVVLAIVLGMAGVAGMLALRAAMGPLDKLGPDDLPAAVARLLRVVAVVAWAGGLGFVGCAWWLFRLARRINRSGRYPPPGMKVVRDTRVRTGRAARTTANAALLFAVLAAAAGTVGMVRLYRTAEDVLRSLGAGP